MKQQDGRYKFSGTVQNVIYHICTYRDRIVVGEAVDQLIHKHFNMEFHYLFGGLESSAPENVRSFQKESITGCRPIPWSGCASA